MHGNMVDICTPRGDNKQFQVFEKRLRHIPAKRIAPYPNTSSIIAQPKRSRTVFSPLPKGKALSLRPVNVCIEKKVNLTQGRLRGNVQSIGAGSKTKGLGIHCQSGEHQRSLPFDHIRFVNNGPKQTCGLVASNSNDKLGCCPLRPSAAVYSTPPYYTKPPSHPGSQRLERSPKIMKFMKVSDIAKNSTVNDLGCLSSVKTAALTTFKVARNCVEDDASSEDCKGSTKMFEGPTASTALVSSSNGSVKTSGSSQGYSSNFNPQLTSTPQRSRYTTNSTESSPQFKMPHPPKETRPTDDLSILLDIVEEERKAGILKMLLLEQPPVMTENSSYVSNSVCASTNPYSFDISNNNKRKLPTMKAIGAPKDASTPIVYSNITERSCKFSQSHRRRHESNELRSHAASVVGLWRPW